jgi:hypothetical protein
MPLAKQSKAKQSKAKQSKTDSSVDRHSSAAGSARLDVPSAPSRARSALFAFLQHRCVQRPAHRCTHTECTAQHCGHAKSSIP